MASKTISVTEEVFEMLKNIKFPHESFGDAIKRLCIEKSAKSLVDWVQKESLWSDLNSEDFNDINILLLLKALLNDLFRYLNFS